jgi:hypothetical protein
MANKRSRRDLAINWIRNILQIHDQINEFDVADACARHWAQHYHKDKKKEGT